MPRFFLITFLIISCTFSDNSIINKLFENNKDLMKPKINYITVKQNIDSIYFAIDSINGTILTHSLKPAEIIIKKKNKIIFNDTSTFKIWGHYLEKVIYFDADNNGLQDIFIISVPVGASGDAANIHQMISLFFLPDDKIKLLDLSSFFGAENLFADYDNNGNFEYACIKLLKHNFERYYTVNLFNFRNGVVANISSDIKNFPLYFNNKDVLNKLPTALEKYAYFNFPNVLYKGE